ncbi:hypothetical protein BC829DRAFT_402317, partial [Chytridium lagenaria]
KFITAAHEDSIWRQTVKNELKAAREWEPVWGFMKDLMIEEAKQTPRTIPSRYERLPPIKPITTISTHASGLPSKLSDTLSTSSSPDPIMTNWMTAYDVKSMLKSRLPIEKYSAPATTSSEIGWKYGTSRDLPGEEKSTGRWKKEWEALQNKFIREWVDDVPEI